MSVHGGWGWGGGWGWDGGMGGQNMKRRSDNGIYGDGEMDWNTYGDDRRGEMDGE